MWKNMEKEEEYSNIEEISAEDALEYLYEISDKWVKEKEPIESMKADLRTMIRYFKEEKFNRMQKEFRVDPQVKNMNEYNCGFEDALDLVADHMQRCKDRLPDSFKKPMAEIMNRVRESKIIKIERKLQLD